MKTQMLRAGVLTAAVLGVGSAPVVRACAYHAALGLPEPVGIWPVNPTAGVPGLTILSAASGAPDSLVAVAAGAPVTDPAIVNWKLNTTAAKAHSADPTINSYVSGILTDVDKVAYDASYVYVHASDVPSYNVGPFPGNPAYPSDRNRTYRIPLNPVAATGTHTNVGLGAVGTMVNGVNLFNALDAMTYQNDNTWHQIANVFEASSFDAGPGHPAPGQGTPQPGQLVAGTYHYHEAPTALIDQLRPGGDNGTLHSPLLGFAFDGFPIYGSYGYANQDGSGGIVRETSSYQLRNITQRHTLPNGTSLPSNQWGPDVSAQYPLGDYAEDYVYVPGSGTLDQYDGRNVVTPEYPGGTYAYFMPLDASLKNVYPYVLGPQYYGVVDTANLGNGTITVPADATYYFALVPEPSGILAGVMAVGLLLRRRRA